MPEFPELKSLSPITDGLVTGQCFSWHDGVACYPAIDEATGDKYIIKVIRIPASPAQTKALELTGAIEKPEDALSYYQDLAQDVVWEAQLLQKLSQGPGFVGCEQVQCDVTEDGTGYEVYIRSPYRPALDRQLGSGDLSRATALRLGLELCDALTACRQAGYLYIDLKPENIVQVPEEGFCIADVGFIRLQGLKFATLPDKYRSAYTAPEMADCLATCGETLDVYALGLVLYQLFNGGSLPQDATVPPLYADYELAQIIATACDADPEKRWQSPDAMRQALLEYMQRNVTDDGPIIPPPIPEPEEQPESVDEVEEFLPEMTEQELREALEEKPRSEPEDEELAQIAALAGQPEPVSTEDPQAPETSDEEMARMLAQAEELMTLVPPEAVTAAEAVEVPMPTPPAPEPEPEPEPVPEPAQEQPAGEAAAEPETEAQPEPAKPVRRKKKGSGKRPWGKLLAVLLSLLLLVALTCGAYYYYNNEYLQYVDALHVTGTDTSVTVRVVSDIEDGLLTLTCADSYGNIRHGVPENGMVVFSDLSPQTRYTLSLQISGFHSLRGETGTYFVTASQTKILSIQAAVGPTDGSVVLSFTTSGPEPESWQVIATAEGQETVRQSFTGNSVTISQLHVGSEYTFLLEPEGQMYTSGETEIRFKAVNIVYATNARIVSCRDGRLEVVWDAPEQETVEYWIVRCCNSAGYDETITTGETSCAFTGLDHGYAATVEITAAGMTRSVSTGIEADPITVLGFTAESQDGAGVTLRWDYAGHAPEGGWTLQWTVNGTAQPNVSCEDALAQLPLYVPGGTYSFTVLAADGRPVLDGSYTLLLPEAQPLDKFGLTQQDVSCRFFAVPEEPDYNWKKLPADAFRADFAAGEAFALLITTAKEPEQVQTGVRVTCLLTGAEGSVIHCDQQLTEAFDLWMQDGHIYTPTAPTAAGSYRLSVYLDGMLVCALDFTIR